MAKNNTEAPEKDIVSFNQALGLCSIGFDEPTFCMYEIENKQLCLCHLDEDGLYKPDKDFHAPTKSQVFRWFRKNYKIRFYIQSAMADSGEYFKLLFPDGEQRGTAYDTNEEAENALIDKLIELAKQQDK